MDSFFINSVLAVWSGSSLVQKAAGDNMKLVEANTIIGLLQNIWNDNGKIGIGTATPTAPLEVDGNIIASNPTANNHVATKAYVDASATVAAGGSCYYILDDGTSCGYGYSLMPGQYAPYNKGFHKICCPSVVNPNPHYFVLTHNKWQGNLGGLAGANEKCRTELTTYNWQGKENVDLESADIKAWLCDGSYCNNFTPNTVYRFAAAGYPSVGGSTIQTGSNGEPSDSSRWSKNTYFGQSVGVWGHRDSNGISPIFGTYTVCNNYTVSNQLPDVFVGQTNNTDEDRWSDIFQVRNCNESYHLYCTVN